MNGDPWTNDRIDQMKALRSEGISWGDVAKRMGLSKNAVLGKASRLGLLNKRPFKLKSVAPVFSFPPPSRCVFPIGHPTDAYFHFCGASVHEFGRPYCSHHMAYCYVSPNQKPDALKQISFAASNLGMKAGR